MSQTLSRSLLAVLLGAIGTSSTVAAPPLPRAVEAASLVQTAKTQCYTKEVCIHWARNPAPHPGAHCVQWVTKTVCEPWVYNNPNKAPDSLPRVHVPKLIAKPKPWQFQRQSSFGLPPFLARSPIMMRR